MRTIILERVYHSGHLRLYPVNDAAKTLAELFNQKTITATQATVLADLGLDIKIIGDKQY